MHMVFMYIHVHTYTCISVTHSMMYSISTDCIHRDGTGGRKKAGDDSMQQ